MGSRTIWRDVYDGPDDDEAWRAFRCHYLPAVYDWARKRVGGAAAEEVTAEVFVRLYRRVRHSPRERVVPAAGSYQPYVWTVVRSVANAYLAELKQRREQALSDTALQELAADSSLDDLEEEVRTFAGYEPAVAELAACYRAAVGRYHDSPRFAEQSFTAFLRVFGGRETGGAVEREFGWSRGLASRKAREVYARLANLMGLPVEEKRSKDILQLMVIRYGDPS
jgi:DNA-directed RNA polymerase specialized sigma24 family protein